jgi:hypothetical protein
VTHVRGFGKKKILKEKESLENLGVDGKITSGEYYLIKMEMCGMD